MCKCREFQISAGKSEIHALNDKIELKGTQIWTSNLGILRQTWKSDKRKFWKIAC